MKYSPGNHRRGTGRSVQRESKQAWLSRRLAEEQRLAWLLAADPETLTERDREEREIKQARTPKTEAELRAFIGL
jgi:hypothetical protein